MLLKPLRAPLQPLHFPSTKVKAILSLACFIPLALDVSGSQNNALRLFVNLT